MGRFINSDAQFDGNAGFAGYNLFSYCANSPIAYKDTSGFAIETTLDIASVILSFLELIGKPSWTAAGYLVWDVAAAIIPFIPASYIAKGFKIAGKIVTPALLGSVLPGITRKSCIELMRSWGYEVEERQISIDELLKAASDGTLEEAWGTGTAAVVSPIGKLFYEGVEYVLSDNKIGALTQRLYDNLTGIQWGKVDDNYGWSYIVCNG